MTKGMLWRRLPCRLALWASVVLVAILLGMATVACRGDDSGGYTPPPATIIRASDSAEPTGTQEATPAATLQEPPTRPPLATPESDYPIPVGTPRNTPTPIVDPTEE